MTGSRPAVVTEVLTLVRQTVALQQLWVNGNTIVVAISGGADSACLLAVLHALREEMALDLRAAHFQHGLRAASETAADERAVSALARRFDVPLVIASAQAQDVSRHPNGVEDAARTARYAFLSEVADLVPGSLVATGHTADDQAETVLHRIVRGTSTHGLAAIPARRGRIVRPLLTVTRQQTHAVCATLGLVVHEDSTNQSPLFTRNRLRHHIIPALEELNPRIRDALVRLAETSASDASYLEQQALAALAGHWHIEQSGALLLDSVAWLAVPPALRPHAVRVLLVAMLGSADGLTLEHRQRIATYIERQARSPNDARLAMLPHHLTLSRTGSAIVMARRDVPPIDRAWDCALPLPGGCSLPFGVGHMTAETLDVWTWEDVRAGWPHQISLDRTVLAVGGPLPAMLTVRSRSAGDRMQPLGMAGHRALQDILTDAKVPRSERWRVPVVTVGEHIIWVVGYCQSDTTRLTSASRDIVRLTWVP